MLRQELKGLSNIKKAKIVESVCHYKHGKLLGQGTFGKVFQAIDQRNGQKVAIKEVLQDKRYKNRQLDIVSRLENDNIIFMKDYYFINKGQDKYLYIIMDYYKTSLQAMFKQQRKLKIFMPPQVRKVLAFQIFKALYYMKNNFVCHRDLKPPNILINPKTFELKLCDFGSAKILDKVQKNVSYICSRYYRAPQLLFQSTSYGTQIDIWSAGCIIVQFLTRQPIFPGDSAMEQLIQIIKVMGTPSQEYMQYYKYDMKQDINLPKIPKTDWIKILKKYNPQQQFIDLISKILVYDIEQRYQPIDCLKHQYFQDLPKLTNITKNLPNLFRFDRLKTHHNGKDINDLYNIYQVIEQQKQTIMVKQLNTLKLQTGQSTPATINQ